MWDLKTRKRLVLLQAMAVLMAVFQYGQRATGQEKGGDSNRILSNFFHPSLTARIPLAGSAVDEWLAATVRMNRARIRVRRRRTHRRYHRMPLRKMLPLLIRILYTSGIRTARAVCSHKLYLYQLILRSVVLYALTEYGGLVNQMLLMISGDVESNPGPQTILKPDDLGRLEILLQPVSAYWISIADHLGMASQIPIIQSTPTPPTFMRDLLHRWLIREHPSPTLEALCQALRGDDEIIGGADVATKLEEMFQGRRGTRTASAVIQSSSTIPPSSEGSEKPPFGCGCGKCTFFTFMVNGCPKPVPSVSSFLYLDLKGLTLEQRQDLERRLRTESKRINMQFQDLGSTTLTSLQKQCVKVCDIDILHVLHLITFGTDESVLKDSQAPVFYEQLNDLEKAGDVSEVFMNLKDYMSFFNYHHIINVFGTEEDKTELKKYKTNFQQYAKRPVSTDYVDVFIIIDSRYMNYTLAEIEDFRETVSDLLGVSPLRLCTEETFQFQKDEPSQLGVEAETPLMKGNGPRTDPWGTPETTDYLRGFEAFAQTGFTITGSSSQSLEWKGYGLKLHVPKGAFPEKQEGCKIDIKAGLAGQFDFPDRSQLVSCIYWISCPQKFLEPVTLEIQHCGDSSQSSGLHFVVAKCSQPELPYKFKALDKGTFSPHSSYGSLQVSQFSFFGIFGKSPRYYSAVYYISKSLNQWYVDFVVTYNLEVHLEAIQTHYSNLAAVHGPHLEVEFEGDRISLEHHASELPNGWTITPLGPPVILKQQVNDYKPQCRIPCCQLLVKCIECRKHVELEHRVNLQGAKNPFNFFTLVCTAETEAPGRTQPPPTPEAVALPTVKAVPVFATPLGPKDLKVLKPLLNPVAAHWVEIADQLDVTQVDIIKQTPGYTPQSGLRDLLHRWLRSERPQPTLEALCQALRADDAIIGGGAVANRLEEKFLGQSDL